MGSQLIHKVNTMATYERELESLKVDYTTALTDGDYSVMVICANLIIIALGQAVRDDPSNRSLREDLDNWEKTVNVLLAIQTKTGHNG